MYDITFELLEPDSEYNYNMVHYEKTVELKTLFKGWFKTMDTLLETCNKKNYLVKTLISQAYGTLSEYKKLLVKKEDAKNYDWEHLKEVSFEDPHEYYARTYENGVYAMIKADKAYKHGGIARIKHFLTEFARGYVFNMMSTHRLTKDIIRVHTDGIVFKRPVDFPALKIDYHPIKEDKTSGTLIFYNSNCYYHVCKDCNTSYYYNKSNPHICGQCEYDECLGFLFLLWHSFLFPFRLRFCNRSFIFIDGIISTVFK